MWKGEVLVARTQAALRRSFLQIGILLVGSCFVLCGGCRTYSDIEVEYAFGAAPLAGFGPSFGWVPGPPPTAGDPRLDRPDLDPFIRERLDEELREKGYTKRSASHDFLLRYAIGKGIGFEKIGPNVKKIDRGSLVVDVVHPTSGKIMWRGVARAKLNYQNPPDVSQKRLRYAIRKLIDQFPGYERN